MFYDLFAYFSDESIELLESELADPRTMFERINAKLDAKLDVIQKNNQLNQKNNLTFI